jgi:nucleotide sugar dehydrogenase
LSSLSASSLFKTVCKEVVILDSPEAAEIAKLASNSYRDLIFGFSNDLARLTNNLGINIREIIDACNYNYPRSNIPYPGPAGGPCLSKDSWILDESAKSLGVELFTPQAARKSNQNVILAFARKLLELSNAPQPKKICLLGLSFKGEPPTADFRGSAAQELLPYLMAVFPNVPIQGHESSGSLNINNLNQIVSLKDALSEADLVFILTNSKDYAGIEKLISAELAINATLIDFWGYQHLDQIREDIKVYKWGYNER